MCSNVAGNLTCTIYEYNSSIQEYDTDFCFFFFFFQTTVFYVIKDSIISEHRLSSFMFALETSPSMKVVAFFFDDDSMFTDEFFRLRAKASAKLHPLFSFFH
ncbi:hypothetical protein ACJW31_09G165100 [Castanea mollissima]